MASSAGGFKIDQDYVANLGTEWANMPNAIGQLKDYAAFNGGSPGDALQVAHFGTTPTAAGAGQAFITLMQNLDNSVAKAKDFADSVSKAFAASAKAASETEAENSLNIITSGQGA
ncbi:MAG TPA: hypothetical protein VHW44_26310 [Pseudonocardiaceae bacterium]|jgi:hypothetical protein|nr:hypothetical protein [Pseudonocardiaceae bacterium]